MSQEIGVGCPMVEDEQAGINLQGDPPQFKMRDQFYEILARIFKSDKIIKRKITDIMNSRNIDGFDAYGIWMKKGK